jgi:hypothetical protein
MHRYAVGLSVGLALTAASAVGLAPAREDPEVVEARKEVLDVLKAVEEGKDEKALAARAEAIHKKGIELHDLAAVYKLKMKGGLGYGARPDPKGGVEKKIIELAQARKGLSKETLKKEKDDLIRLGNLNVAMAAINRAYSATCVPKRNESARKDWHRFCDEQKKAAMDLIEAVKKEDGDGVARAAKGLLSACCDCHGLDAGRH